MDQFPVYKLHWTEETAVDSRSDTFVVTVALAIFGASVAVIFASFVRCIDGYRKDGGALANEYDDGFTLDACMCCCGSRKVDEDGDPDDSRVRRRDRCLRKAIVIVLTILSLILFAIPIWLGTSVVKEWRIHTPLKVVYVGSEQNSFSVFTADLCDNMLIRASDNTTSIDRAVAIRRCATLSQFPCTTTTNFTSTLNATVIDVWFVTGAAASVVFSSCIVGGEDNTGWAYQTRVAVIPTAEQFQLGNASTVGRFFSLDPTFDLTLVEDDLLVPLNQTNCAAEVLNSEPDSLTFLVRAVPADAACPYAGPEELHQSIEFLNGLSTMVEVMLDKTDVVMDTDRPGEGVEVFSDVDGQLQTLDDGLEIGQVSLVARANVAVSWILALVTAPLAILLPTVIRCTFRRK